MLDLVGQKICINTVNEIVLLLTHCARDHPRQLEMLHSTQ